MIHPKHTIGRIMPTVLMRTCLHDANMLVDCCVRYASFAHVLVSNDIYIYMPYDAYMFDC